jgi:hypothetical protein
MIGIEGALADLAAAEIIYETYAPPTHEMWAAMIRLAEAQQKYLRERITAWQEHNGSAAG